MKFHCIPTNGGTLNKDVVVRIIEKALTDGEDATYEEIGDGSIRLEITNEGKKTRERVEEILTNATGMTYQEAA